MKPSICVLISQAPYGTVHAAEAVRHINGALSEGFDVVAVLVNEGVWLARDGQQAEGSGFTALSEALAASLNKPGGPVPRVLADRASLDRRGLTASTLVPGIEVADSAGISAAILSTQHLLRF
ncbi:MAG: DsrE family protein [Bacillota bacterium]